MWSYGNVPSFPLTLFDHIASRRNESKINLQYHIYYLYMVHKIESLIWAIQNQTQMKEIHWKLLTSHWGWGSSICPTLRWKLSLWSCLLQTLKGGLRAFFRWLQVVGTVGRLLLILGLQAILLHHLCLLLLHHCHCHRHCQETFHVLMVGQVGLGRRLSRQLRSQVWDLWHCMQTRV